MFMKLKLKEKAMDKDRVKGSTTNITGEMKEGAGKLTGDEKLKERGCDGPDQREGPTPLR